jgi:hypothetical protein
VHSWPHGNPRPIPVPELWVGRKMQGERLTSSQESRQVPSQTSLPRWFCNTNTSLLAVH